MTQLEKINENSALGEVKYSLLDDIVYPGSPTATKRKTYCDSQLTVRRKSCDSEFSEISHPTDSYYSAPTEPEEAEDISNFNEIFELYSSGTKQEEEPQDFYMQEQQHADMDNYPNMLSRLPSFSNLVHPHPDDLASCEPSMKRQRTEQPSDQYWLDNFLDNLEVQQLPTQRVPMHHNNVTVQDSRVSSAHCGISAIKSEEEVPSGNNDSSQAKKVTESKKREENQRNSWTKQEDELLKKAVRVYGYGNFTHVATMVPGRSNTQCRARWVRVLKPGLRKGQWNSEEDEKLLTLIRKYGKGIENRVAGQEIEIDWNNMRDQIQGRSVKQCRERWTKNLDPTLKKGEWTEAEDNLIVQRQKELGNRWAQISRELPGRTEHSVKTRWRSLVRVHKRHWTPAEDELLLVLRKKMTTSPGFRWEDVAQQFPNRTKDAVMTRYKVLAAKQRAAAAAAGNSE